MSESTGMEQNLEFMKCVSHKKGERPLSPALIKGYLRQLPGWKQAGKQIVKNYTFHDFHETMGFVNALAFIANREDHHPDLEVGYKTCKVRYSSHDIGGLSENDFICAKKIEGFLNGVS